METDSPFLSPNKDVDKRNYPWNIKLSAEKIGKVKHVETDKILEFAERNARKVFKLDSSVQH